jgi:hypothetical protein
LNTVTTTYLQYKMHFQNTIFDVSTHTYLCFHVHKSNEIEHKIFITKSSKKIITHHTHLVKGPSSHKVHWLHDRIHFRTSNGIRPYDERRDLRQLRMTHDTTIRSRHSERYFASCWPWIVYTLLCHSVFFCLGHGKMSIGICSENWRIKIIWLFP